jgi:hypothetical protein
MSPMGGAGRRNVLLWECNDDPDHVWSFTPNGELRNTLNGTCLDAAGYRGEQGANVDCIRCEALNGPALEAGPRADRTFELRNVQARPVPGRQRRAGARGRRCCCGCDGARDQLWSFEAYARPADLPAPHAVSEPPTRLGGALPRPGGGGP